MCVWIHTAGTATASATVVASHDTTVTANRTRANLLNSPHVRGLPQVLGAVVDDAHQARASRHRRVPVGVHHPGQLVGRHAGDVFEGELMHRVVVAGEQLGGRVDLPDLVGAVPVARVVAGQVQGETVHPSVSGPHLFDPGDVRQLEVLHPGAVPEQPGDAVGVRGGSVGGHLVAQSVGEVVDVFDQPGECVAEEFLGGF